MIVGIHKQVFAYNIHNEIMNNVYPISLTKENFPPIISSYFPVEDNIEDLICLFHVHDHDIDEYIKSKHSLLISYLKYKSSELEKSKRLESSLEFLGDDLTLVPYNLLSVEGSISENYEESCSKSDIEELNKYMKDKLQQLEYDESVIDNLLTRVSQKIPENYFSYNSNKEYIKQLHNYITSCRFTNLNGYFKMAEPIFSIQSEIFELFRTQKNILVSGGTGVGKTAVIPLLYYHYLKSQVPVRDDYSIYICEPRISTTKNPYQFLRLNTGSDFKFTFNNLEKIIDKKYNITRKLKTRSSEYIERVYDGFQSIQMVYRGHNKRFRNTHITFMTDGIFYVRLIHNPKSIFKQSLIVIDEVHENSLNSLVGLAVLSAYIDEDCQLETNKLSHVRVMLITAQCQPSEKIIFANLLPGLYEFDKLPSVTKYKVTEIARPRAKLEECINKSSNGLVFVPNEMAIDSYIKELSGKFSELLIIKLTRDTNIKIYNGDVTRFLLTYAIEKNRKYLVVATNVAESSITFPKLDYVIDLGRQLNVNYDIFTRSYKVETEYMTLNSKVQRMGRVGRTQDGEYIRLYEQSDLMEFKNRIRSENMGPRLIEIICTMKSDSLRKRIIDKIRDSFGCREVIEQYIQEFEYLNLIVDKSTYMPSKHLEILYKFKSKLRNEYKNASNEISDLLSDDDDNDESVDNDEEDDKLAEHSDVEFKLLNLLYHCNIEQIKKLLILVYDNDLLDLLNSPDYVKFATSNTTESDIIVLLKYLESYNMKNRVERLESAIQKLGPFPVVGILEDIDMLIFRAIDKALYFDITYSTSRSKYSRVRRFQRAYVLEFDKSCSLVHSTGYVRDFNLSRF